MPVLRPGALPSDSMDVRAWARWCGQKPLYETALVTVTPFTAGKEELILVNDTTIGGAATVNLPPIETSEGLQYIIKKMGNTANVTVDGYSSETIDGAATLALTTQYEKTHLVCYSSGWVTV